MRRRENRAGELQQRPLQRLQALQVQMIGGLVQQQQIGAAVNQAGDAELAPLPQAQVRHCFVCQMGIAEQAAAVQQGQDVVGAFMADGAQDRDDILRFVEGCAGLIEVADFCARHHFDAPAGRRQLARDQSQQGGLAAAVGRD